MNKTDIYLIEDHIIGDLSPKENEDFNFKLRSDYEFKKEFLLRKEIEETLGDFEMLELRQILKDVSSQTNGKSRYLSFHKLSRYAAAALIFIAIGFSSILMWEFMPLNNERILNKYYQPYESISTVRSGNQSIDMLLKKAMTEYEKMNFEEAMVYFQKVLDADKNNVIGNFYNGVSSLEVKKFTSAEKSFNNVINHKENLFIEQSHWYLGFCYLMTDNDKKAKEHFEILVKESTYYKDKAKKLLRHIR